MVFFHITLSPKEPLKCKKVDYLVMSNFHASNEKHLKGATEGHVGRTKMIPKIKVTVTNKRCAQLATFFYII